MTHTREPQTIPKVVLVCQRTVLCVPEAYKKKHSAQGRCSVNLLNTGERGISFKARGFFQNKE